MGLSEKIKGAFVGTPEPSAAAPSPGNAYEGAERMNLELARWNPPLMSADAEILDAKETLDARGRDMVRNDPLIANAVDIYKNGVVGTKFVLNAKPNGRALGWSDDVVEAVQEEIESLFEIYAHSGQCYLDATRKMNLTDIVRLGTGSVVTTGEFLATFEWMPNRPFGTVVQVVDPDRLSNPDFKMDTRTLRGGVETTEHGEPLAYWIRTAHPSDALVDGNGMGTWKRVPARKPWGRAMVLHVYDILRPDQRRGVAKMVAALRQMKMTAKFSDVALQNAVIQATIAATIESEKGPDEVYAQLGADGGMGPDFSAALHEYASAYLNEAMAYGHSGNVARLNGAMIPHLFPGTKLNVKPLGDGTLGTAFEDSLIRKIAAGLGVSYEELNKNLAETSFAGVKAAMAQTHISMMSVKRSTADKIANAIYRNWLEEVVNAGLLRTLPAEARVPGWAYRGTNLDALANATWIGASRGTIDEYNEMRAAKMRLDLGISTLERESARLGDDWREVQKQRRREARYLGGPVSVAVPVAAPASGASAEASTEDRLAAIEDHVDQAHNEA